MIAIPGEDPAQIQLMGKAIGNPNRLFAQGHPITKKGSHYVFVTAESVKMKSDFGKAVSLCKTPIARFHTIELDVGQRRTDGQISPTL